MDFSFNAEGAMVPAMPNNLFGYQETLLELMAGNAIDLNYRETLCKAVIMQLRSVPVKPDPRHITNPQWRQAARGRTSTLDRLYPQEVLPHNIGANEGLARVLRLHYEAEGQDREGVCNRYTSFNCDVDIFARVLKVRTRLLLSFLVVYPENGGTFR